MVVLKYLIVGTGRCGTTYLSRMFNHIGINCGHESIFTPFGYNKALDLLKENNFEAESSWLSAPFIDKRLLKNTTIIHIVRDPLTTIPSFLCVNLFSEKTVYNEFIYKYVQIKNLSEELQPVAYYIKWNRLIKEKSLNCHYVFHRVEDDIEILFEKLNLKISKEIESRFYMTSNSVDFDINKIENKEVKESLIQIQKEFGYDAN